MGDTYVPLPNQVRFYCKISHDLTMIDRDIHICNNPRPFLCQFQFSCVDCSSVASRTKNDEIMMNCYRFRDMYSKPGIRTGSTRNTSDFDRNLLQVLIQSPVVRGYKNRVNFENRYFNPQGGYEQILMVYGQT